MYGAVEDLMMSDFRTLLTLVVLELLQSMTCRYDYQLSRKNIMLNISTALSVPARTSDKHFLMKLLERHIYSLEEGIELLSTWVRGEVQHKQSSLDNYCFFDILITMKGEGNGRCNRSRLWWQHRNGV